MATFRRRHLLDALQICILMTMTTDDDDCNNDTVDRLLDTLQLTVIATPR